MSPSRAPPLTGNPHASRRAGGLERGPARGRGHRAVFARGLAVTLVLGILVVGGCRSQPQELARIGRVSGLGFVDQAGRPFVDATLRGKVWAAAFMFTRCPTVCPRITKAMRGVQVQAAQAGTQLHLVSFSVDPDNDTPPVLARYARRFEADLRSWSFVTGDPARILEVAQHGFKLALEGKADEKADHFGITHGSHLVLVDPELNIRGYYSTSDPAELTRLVQDAATLAR